MSKFKQSFLEAIKNPIELAANITVLSFMTPIGGPLMLIEDYVNRNGLAPEMRRLPWDKYESAKRVFNIKMFCSFAAIVVVGLPLTLVSTVLGAAAGLTVATGGTVYALYKGLKDTVIDEATTRTDCLAISPILPPSRRWEPSAVDRNCLRKDAAVDREYSATLVAARSARP